jgi:hypothetical protein
MPQFPMMEMLLYRPLPQSGYPKTGVKMLGEILQVYRAQIFQFELSLTFGVSVGGAHHECFRCVSALL